jgi:two-component system, cell cycle sensor histidine kinase and response regulator CckA
VNGTDFLKHGNRWTLVGVAVAALLSVLIVWWPTGSVALAAGFGAAGLLGIAGLWSVQARREPSAIAASDEQGADWALVRSIADQAGDAMAVTDKSGRLVCANQRFLDWFGGVLTPPNLPVDDAVNRAMSMAGREAWATGSAAIAPFAVGTATFAGRIERIGRGADYLLWRWFNENGGGAAAPLPDQLAGALGGALGTSLDRAGIMVALVGADGRMRAANLAFALRALGDERLDVQSRAIAQFLTVDGQGLIRFTREVDGEGSTPIRVLEIALSDGPDSDLLMLIIDEDGGPGERAVALDYVESLLAHLPAGLAMVDRDGRLLYANPAFQAEAQGEAGDRSRYPTDLVVAEDKAAFGEMIRRQAGAASGTSSISVRLKAQPQQPVSIGLTPVRGIGEAAVMLSIQSSQQEDELKAQVVQAQKMQAVGQLAGGIAHDFNNILTGILGSCDLMLLRHAPGDSDYDDIQQIRSNTNRAANLTRQLLAFSRQQTLRPQIVNLADVIADVSHLLQRLIGEQIKLDVHHGRGLGTVRADPGQLEQVIVNLAVNARDAMPKGGTLTISTAPIDGDDGQEVLPGGRYARLEVRDTGTGIAPDVLPKIFDPFFTTKAVGQGTGLGLATVYGIVKQSGGFIFAQSPTGGGTCFSVYLPVIEGGAAEAIAARTESAPVARSVQWGSGTILLVEDEDVVRAVAERALVRAGYQVITAVDGEDGLNKFAANQDIDLIISDVMMPEMDGPTMAARIREARGDLPVLFMSGYAEEQLRKSISIANVGFLPKPFAVAQLIDAVAAVHQG